ncbi:DnaJ protein, putative [Plasmodium reichenowi]|uniref:DnaJ protein, putative n=1 Tax=Plasmodium reichenowi TaxID=5854 RepID=A0A151LUS2_PLARE|nr:DnaJ protein, putative [Plasmodium reichenowi]KYO02937.1 DnaJ protein, putative [Plasmodium reichenowi]
MKCKRNVFFSKSLKFGHISIFIFGILCGAINKLFINDVNSYYSVSNSIIYERQLSEKDNLSNSLQQNGEPVVIGQFFSLPNEKSFIISDDIFIDEEQSIVNFIDNIIEGLEQYMLWNNYMVIPHMKQYPPVFNNDKDIELNNKVDNLERNGEDIITGTEKLWLEIMKNEKNKFASLKCKLFNQYNKFKNKHNIPKEQYAKGCNLCKKLIEIGEKNLELKLNSVFYEWYDKKVICVEDFRRKIERCRIAWKALSNKIQYLCNKIIINCLDKIKYINEMKIMKAKKKDVKVVEKPETKKKQEENLSMVEGLNCFEENHKIICIKNNDLIIGCENVDNQGCPLVNNIINSSSINYYEKMRDGLYHDDEEYDALVTDDDLIFEMFDENKEDDIIEESENNESDEDESIIEEFGEAHEAVAISSSEVVDDEFTTNEDIGSEERYSLDKEANRLLFKNDIYNIWFSDLSNMYVDTTYYDILKVHPTSELSEIKSSYYNLALKYNPESNLGNDEALRKFRDINEAYQILSFDQRRMNYNKYGLDATKDMLLIDPSIFYVKMLSIEKFYDYIGTTQIESFLKVLSEKNIALHELEHRLEDIMNLMHEQQEVREVKIALYLRNKLQPYVDGDDQWKKHMEEEVKKLNKSIFGTFFLKSIGWTYTNLTQCYREENGHSFGVNLKLANMEFENRNKKNQLKVSKSMRNFLSIIKEYIPRNENITGLVKKIEYLKSENDIENNISNVNEKSSSNDNSSDDENENSNENSKGHKLLSDNEKRKVLHFMIKNMKNVVKGDIELTIRYAAEKVLFDEDVDKETQLKRVEALEILGNIMKTCSKENKNWKNDQEADIENIIEKVINVSKMVNNE